MGTKNKAELLRSGSAFCFPEQASAITCFRGFSRMLTFISYCRESLDVVRTLKQDIEALGHEVWLDQELPGGHVWWNKVLEKIRECDLFIFALAPKALDSYPCKLEYTYAFDLNKRILPVLVADDVSINFLPPELSSIQFVDYRSQDKQAFSALLKAINSLPTPQPLPDPLPQPPEVPVSAMGLFKDQVETTATLSFEEQLALVVKLENRLESVDEGQEARHLLEKLQNRDDLFAKVAAQIDTLLSKSDKVSFKREANLSIQASPTQPSLLSNSQYISPTIKNGVSVFSEPSSIAIVYKGHQIKIQQSFMRKIVIYDGKKIGKIPESLYKKPPPFTFRVNEEGEEIKYEIIKEINYALFEKLIFKRNGELLYKSNQVTRF